MNNVNHRRKALFVGIMGASALLLAEGTMAQDDVTNLGIEEMVVTAQKREENVQAVPISISTLSANDIERRGVQSAADLMSTVPNMAGFQSPGARGNASIAMRGVTSGSPANLSIDSSIIEAGPNPNGSCRVSPGRNATAGITVSSGSSGQWTWIRSAGRRHRCGACPAAIVRRNSNPAIQSRRRSRPTSRAPRSGRIGPFPAGNTVP